MFGGNDLGDSFPEEVDEEVQEVGLPFGHSRSKRERPLTAGSSSGPYRRPVGA